MNAPTKAMILAAGEGQRMRPLTLSTPKPLLCVHGTPLIVHHIRRLVAAGITDIIINTAYLGQQIHAALGDGKTLGASIRYSHEGATGLETAGGIRRALPLLGRNPFILVNADIYTDYDYRQLKTASQTPAHLVLVNNPPQHPKGDFQLEHDIVRNLPTAAHEPAPTLTYSGIARLHPQLFQDIPPGKHPLAPILRRAADLGQLSGEHYQGEWHDIGTPERLDALNQTTHQ
ncbi:MAG: mannose-1-phosphate guanylyltransferase [Gammaproteobacteria bacterium 28-57-27]|nr:MAG: mannose-1-phosphate guanylyltransferase [Gammaproteobacteria bacterium 28-57-27]